MLILGVIIVLAIVYTAFIIGCGVGKGTDARVFMLCYPIVGIIAIFFIISSVTPAKYEEIQLKAEYELAEFTVNESLEVYAVFDNGKYVCYLNDGTNKPMSYNLEKVSSIIYINEEETPKVCEYVEECVWSWYAVPVYPDITSYVLYIPEGSIHYGAISQEGALCLALHLKGG